jgi:hypothetical protein
MWIRRLGLGCCAALLVLAQATSPAAAKPVTSKVQPGRTGVRVLGWGLYEPDALASSGSDLFAANFAGNSVTEVSASTGALVRVIHGPSFKFGFPDAVAVSGSDLFVANGGGESITVQPAG